MSHRLFFLIFALLSNGSNAEDFFSGEWDGSEHVYLRQVGSKVCGLWRYIATGREYEGRLTGTATLNYLKIDQVCGTPGGRASTHCADTAPRGEVNVGWSPSGEGALICDGRLLIAKSMPRTCPPSSQTATWDSRVSAAVARQDFDTFEPSEVAWATSCATAPNPSHTRSSSGQPNSRAAWLPRMSNDAWLLPGTSEFPVVLAGSKITSE